MQKTGKTTTTTASSPFLAALVRRSRGVRVLTVTLSGLLAGLVASLLAVGLMGLFRLVLGIPSPVELFGDVSLKHMDAGTFVHLLIIFAPNSKTGPLGLALLGMIGVGTVLGPVYALMTRLRLPPASNRPERREWRAATTAGAGGRCRAGRWRRGRHARRGQGIPERLFGL